MRSLRNNLLVITGCILMIECVSAFILDQQNDDPTVETNCGRMSGLVNSTDGGFTFRGIPYASPPVNALRWRRPVHLDHSNHNCWNGVLDATQFRDECVQTDLDSDTVYGKEDCLFLNVWTPTLNSSAHLPVMVYIHGGSLLIGNGNDQDIGYAPTTKLAVDTNMVHVSLNYRLNAFGFMALEWLVNGSETNTSGNYGFMDQIEVLRWVQQNIEHFGGDRNQVTLYGQSSGGTSLFALLASPLCQGLFHKAWLSSASPLLNKTKEDAFRDNEVFVQNTGCKDVQCLYSLTAEQVIRSVPWYVYPYWAMDDQIALPVKNLFDGGIAIIDGYVLHQSPFDAWTEGNGVDVPLLIGTTAQETDLELSPAEAVNWTWSSQDYENHVRGALSPFNDIITNMALKLYPVNISTPRYQLSSMISDVRVGCGNDYLTQIAASSFKSPVYRYVATYSPSQPMHAFGVPIPSPYAFHGIDIFAFFGTEDVFGYSLTAADQRWIDNVRREVLHFVKTGSPSSVTWGTYPDVTAILSESTTVSCGYHKAACQFWLTNGFYSYSWVN